MNRNGLRWRDTPKDHGPHKTLYDRWNRWDQVGVFARMMEGLPSAGAERKTVMIDATYLKAQWLLADRATTPTGSGTPCRKKGITPCIPGRKFPREAQQIRQAPLQAP